MSAPTSQRSLRREPSVQRWAWAEIDLGAIAHNVGAMTKAAGGASVWAVVKADAYGHGSVEVATTALAAGAQGVCVALVQEASELRRAGIGAPLLILTEQPPEQFAEALNAEAELVVYNPDTLVALGEAARDVDRIAQVHLHIDTGMNRVGVQPDDAVAVAERIHADPHLERVGTMTHFACADDPSADANKIQLERFTATLDTLKAAGLPTGRVHAANSAATLALAAAHFDQVRAGIAIYGISPGPGVDDLSSDLRPALTLAARVSHIKRVEAGVHVSYGWRYQTERPTTLVTLPIGYADGVRRGLSSTPDGQPGAPVLLGGRRHPIVGVVTMDQTIVDVGDAEVSIGDQAVLIGEQGGDRIRAEEWAQRLDTIGYEVVCGIGDRVPRIILDTQ